MASAFSSQAQRTSEGAAVAEGKRQCFGLCQVRGLGMQLFSERTQSYSSRLWALMLLNSSSRMGADQT